MIPVVVRKLCLLMPVAALVLLASVAVADIRVNIFSDAHYDPGYATAHGYGKCTTGANSAKYGATGCDAPAVLMESLVADLSAQSNAYSLFAGDWQRHDFDDTSFTAVDVFEPMAKWMAGIAHSGTPSPAAPAFVGTWGNNDVVPDYYFDYKAAEQPELKTRVDMLVNHKLMTAEEATTMSKCAFFARKLTADVTIVSLHTLLWSHKLEPAADASDADPCGQFQFLEKELSDARTQNRKVIVIGHIAPSVDTFLVLNHGSFRTPEKDMLWLSAYQQRYEDLIRSYTDVVKLQVFGHTHTFALFSYSALGTPSFISPSITQLFGNIPSYLVATFSDSWDLLELRQRFMLNDGTWRDGMDVKGALGLRHGFMDMDSTQQSLYALATNDMMWRNYMELRSGGALRLEIYPKSTCDSFCRAVVVCSLVNSSHTDVKACVENLMRTTKPTVDVNLNESIVTTVLILGVVLSVTAIAVLYYVIPKIRTGEMSLDKIEFDFKAQLLNSTPKKEKARQRAEEERLQRARAAATSSAAMAVPPEVDAHGPIDGGDHALVEMREDALNGMDAHNLTLTRE